jgi:alcohol dehydrogenase class IV
LDYAEVIGLGKPLTRPSLPFIAIPTTAGTGTEVTRNAVLASPGHRVKVSLRSPHLLPRLALVDPELTYSLPPGPTASTGLDALTQLIEPFLSARANPMTDALAREGMRRIARSLRRACDHGGDVEAREDLSLASLFGGLVMANASLGAVHGIANPFGGMFPSPHGAVCARLLAPVMAANIRAAKERQPGSELLRRLDEVAQTLTGSAAAAADEAVVWLRDVCRALEIPPLSSYGMTPADFPDLIQRALVASSMKANPVTLTQDELRQILDEAI